MALYPITRTYNVPKAAIVKVDLPTSFINPDGSPIDNVTLVHCLIQNQNLEGVPEPPPYVPPVVSGQVDSHFGTTPSFKVTLRAQHEDDQFRREYGPGHPLLPAGNQEIWLINASAFEVTFELTVG